MKNFILFLAVIFCLAACKGSQKSSKPRKRAHHSKPTVVKEKNIAQYKEREVDAIDIVIKEAKSYTGTPYKWGGNTRMGLDCSGLMCLSFKEVGIQLPRNSAQQSNVGRRVDIREIQPGDLVFFSTEGGKGINHVGLVTEVSGSESIRFIHASYTLGVMEDNLFSNYYKKAFVKAVRPEYN